MSEVGFTYVWLHRDSGKYYIGSHKGSPDDGYVGSGKRFKVALKKYGIEAFTRTIDYIGPDFRQEETDLIAFFDACNCALSYNISHIHKNGAEFGAEHIEKLSKAKVGVPRSDAARAAVSLGQQKRYAEGIHHMLGKKHSEEARANMNAHLVRTRRTKFLAKSPEERIVWLNQKHMRGRLKKNPALKAFYSDLMDQTQHYEKKELVT